MRLIPKAIAPALVAAMLAAPDAAQAGDALLEGRGLAPYRFNPPPQDLSPAQEGVAQSYRSRLQSGLSPLERQRLDDTPQGRRELRSRRSELNRMERLLNDR